MLCLYISDLILQRYNTRSKYNITVFIKDGFDPRVIATINQFEHDPIPYR